MAPTLESLERQREEILKEMRSLGDMRRGSIVEHYLRCGKFPCCCKRPGHPGHGPYFAFTRKLQGKTQTRQLRSGPVLTKLRREVENFHRFRALSDRLIEVNEALGELRPLADTDREVKKTSRAGSRRRFGRKSTAG